jgi:hypothetical protein
MTDCLRLAEWMPEVALGRREWSQDEREHLARCASCRREWEVVCLTQGLGKRELPRLDPERTARLLLLRLRRSRIQRARRIWGLTGLGLAASLAAILWSRAPDPAPTTSGSLAAGLEIPLPELEGLEPGELDSVLTSMDLPLAADAEVDSPELGDLDSVELETVLEIWEG